MTTATTTIDFAAWSHDHLLRIEETLQRVLPAAEIAPQRLHQAMRYAVLGGGKRVRPLLAFAAGELADADPERVAIAGSAVELIHAYSLAHDDLPCMDDDVLRRGRPTCHVEYDEPTALLVGDALQSLAFQLLGEYRLADDMKTQLEMVKLLAAASGSRGMAGGQAIDLDSVGKALSVPELGSKVVSLAAHARPPSVDGKGEERQRIEEALDRCGGNQSRAAKLLGISRATLVNRLNVYGFPRPRKCVG